jgi:hypothetical protein
VDESSAQLSAVIAAVPSACGFVAREARGRDGRVGDFQALIAGSLGLADHKRISDSDDPDMRTSRCSPAFAYRAAGRTEDCTYRALC